MVHRSLVQNGTSEIAEARTHLPIWAGRNAIITAVRQNDTIVILGDTGSGKTTQLPQFLFDAGFTSGPPNRRIIGITQPRRVAATSLAKRVAAEMGSKDPSFAKSTRKPKMGVSTTGGSTTVGYAVRFDDCTNSTTRIKFMTDGLLLREVYGFEHNGQDSTSQGSRAPLQNVDERKYTLLTQYSVLIIDEAHERSVRTDLVLGIVKRIQTERKLLREKWKQAGKPAGQEVKKLKVIIMSATIDAEAFSSYFATMRNPVQNSFSGLSPNTTARIPNTENNKKENNVPILYVKGRQHSVTVFHATEPLTDWTDAAKRTIMQIHATRDRGDILVFMTGQEEIEALAYSLRLLDEELPAWSSTHRPNQLCQRLFITPLYAALGPNAVTQVFSHTPTNMRKIVLATNIAETSVTIPGIRYVVDCGLAKEKVFTAKSGIETLTTAPISQSAAQQRAGRAGREAPGECYRLYTQDTFESLPQTSIPEILRADLAPAILDVVAMGFDPYSFDWMNSPSVDSIDQTVLSLIELNALEVSGPNATHKQTPSEALQGRTFGKKMRLTSLGRRMASLPLPPSASRALLAAEKYGPVITRQVRDLVAILSAERPNLFLDPSEESAREKANLAKASFAHPSGDHATQLTVLYSYLDMRRATRHGGFERSNGALTVSLEEDRNGSRNVDNTPAKDLKAWCQAHFIHERTVKEVLAIRKQLKDLCKRGGLMCDDHCAETDISSVDAPEAPNTASELDDTFSNLAKGKDNNYVELRKCMLQGRLTNVAIRHSDGTGAYKRLFGNEVVKVHPSSTLSTLVGRRGAQAVMFEELTLTTQTFLRTVSAIEPSWIQEATQTTPAG